MLLPSPRATGFSPVMTKSTGLSVLYRARSHRHFSNTWENLDFVGPKVLIPGAVSYCHRVPPEGIRHCRARLPPSCCLRFSFTGRTCRIIRRLKIVCRGDADGIGGNSVPFSHPHRQQPYPRAPCVSSWYSDSRPSGPSTEFIAVLSAVGVVTVSYQFRNSVGSRPLDHRI